MKDEYTPGSGIVGGVGIDLDGPDIGTIHHPSHIGITGYPAMQIHQTGSGIFPSTPSITSHTLQFDPICYIHEFL